ncbi:hypothetical protein BKA66DRAFT_462497 [Pyrenochaeta sp. MPI-SDFR-AT-0127]|nr:hypothetical protein BKA66DRAFT_462497 [Pyrenochaeta sp. MPI-SDFR-AT-0127]
MVSCVVAVAGGTGKLGRTIVDELVAHGGYKVFILGRKANAQMAKELGADILVTDYNNINSVANLLEINNIDTVISTLGSTFGPDSELTLIQAAQNSMKTTRYIPSIWGISCTSEAAAIFPTMNSKIAYLDVLAATSLEYTAVLNGIFLDYYGFPKVKSYLGNLPRVIDIAQNAAAIPASGNVPVVFSYSFDVGRFIAALLSQSKWEKESVIIGDKITWNDFLALAERVKGVKFDVKIDSLETLQKGYTTELPSQRDLYPFLPKEKLQRMCATFGILFENGFFDFKSRGTLNETFPEINTKSVEALLKEAWSSN